MYIPLKPLFSRHNGIGVQFTDEPTGNLDSRSGKEIMMLLHNLHEEGNTIVLITHDNNVAMEAPRQVQISDGKIIKDSGGEAEYEDYTSN